MDRISLETIEMEGNNNCYLSVTGETTTLIDTGFRNDRARERLREGLQQRGSGFGDVDRIFLTHWHSDHTGLAGEIQSQSGAYVYCHARDAPLVRGDNDEWEQYRDLTEASMRDWQIPEAKRTTVLDGLERGIDSIAFPTVTPFTEGDEFTFDGRTHRVVHTPGHTAGLSVFETKVDGQRVVYSGDTLLPKYTPNIGGADVRVDRPLQQYIQSLRRVAAADYDRAWPGHRDPIDDPTGRAEGIIAHHEQRAEKILSILARHSACSAWNVARDLFGEMERVHILQGAGEAYAHLDNLEREGFVNRDGKQYRITEETSERLQSDSLSDPIVQ